MKKIDFQPIFDYIDENSKRLREDLMSEVRSEIRKEIGEVKTAIANLTSDVQSLTEEMIVSNRRIRRLEGWAEPVGKKVGIPIEF